MTPRRPLRRRRNGEPRPSCLQALLVLLVLSVAPEPSRGADSEPRFFLSGYLANDTAYRLRSPFYLQKSQSRLELDLDARVLDSLRLQILTRVQYDPCDNLVGPDPDFGQRPIDRWQVAGSSSLEAELREVYLDWSGDAGPARLDLRLGKQQIVWGQAIGLRILDVINAQDYREFILDDFIDARIPTFAARLDVSLRDWSFQAFVIPDYEPDRLPDPSSEFAFDPELRGLLPSFALSPPLPAQDLFVTFPVTLTFPGSPLPLEVPVTVNAGPQLAGASLPPIPLVTVDGEKTPADWRGSTLGFGFRLGREWRGVDLALYYHDAFDSAPTFRRRIEESTILVPVEVPLPDFSPAEVDPKSFGIQVPVVIRTNHLQMDHVRVRSVGASFATARGAFTFWGEGITSFGRALVVDDLDDADGIVRAPQIRYVLGLDWTGVENLLVGVQWIQQILPSYRSTIELDRVTSLASLLLRLGLRDDSVIAQLFVMYGLNERELMIRPSLEWKVSDRFSLMLGADVFTGGRSGLFGQYAHARSCVEVPALPAGVEIPGVALPPAGECLIDTPAGRPSRIFLQARYYFDSAF